jgi:hypothetical protein
MQSGFCSDVVADCPRPLLMRNEQDHQSRHAGTMFSMSGQKVFETTAAAERSTE